VKIITAIAFLVILAGCQSAPLQVSSCAVHLSRSGLTELSADVLNTTKNETKPNAAILVYSTGLHGSGALSAYIIPVVIPPMAHERFTGLQLYGRRSPGQPWTNDQLLGTIQKCDLALAEFSDGSFWRMKQDF